MLGWCMILLAALVHVPACTVRYIGLAITLFQELIYQIPEQLHAPVTFGRVPLFYYLLHIPAIHAAALVASLIREGRINPWLLANHP